jgi:2-methylcitrate dehydratase
MESVSKQLSKYVEDLKFKDLSEEVVYRLKQHILDTLGCIFHGFPSHSASITRKLLLGKVEEATIIGTNKKDSCITATLANGVALRQSEYLDYLPSPLNPFAVCHPSEAIPAALAIAEKVDSSGKDFLLSVFISYELHGRFCVAMRTSSLSAAGFHHTTLGYLIQPLVIGKLLNLKAEQLANAMGISGCMANAGIIDAEEEEFAEVKNIAYPIAAQASIIATLLAKDGFTGTERVLEGEKGFMKSILRENMDFDALLKGGERPWIFETRLKPYPIVGAGIGIIDATLNLVKKYSINPSDVENILVKSSKKTVTHICDPAKKHPKTKESADHSAYFLVAIAILEKKVTPDLFRDDVLSSLLSNTTVHELSDKITFEVSPELNDPKLYPAAEVIIKTKSGLEYSHKALYPKGHPKNPMSEKEVEEKFLQGASSILGENKAREVIKAVYRLDKMRSISELTELLRT